MHRRYHALFVALIAVTLAACGSTTADSTAASDSAGDATTTVAGEVTTSTTTQVPESTTTTVDGLSIDDVTPECLAVISELLHGYEPAVKDTDWEHATIDDHLRVMYALASFSIDDTSACDQAQLDTSEEEGSALFLAIAQTEAPGTVGYFTAIMEINKALAGRHASGDCLTDIATFEQQVTGGVPWVNRALPEQWLTLNLMSSIGYCSLQTQGELRFRPEVVAFLDGSPFA